METPKIKEIKDKNGNKYTIVAELQMNDKTFAISLDKIIFEKVAEGKYKRCFDKDETAKQLQDFLDMEVKSLDIMENDDISR